MKIVLKGILKLTLLAMFVLLAGCETTHYIPQTTRSMPRDQLAVLIWGMPGSAGGNLVAIDDEVVDKYYYGGTALVLPGKHRITYRVHERRTSGSVTEIIPVEKTRELSAEAGKKYYHTGNGQFDVSGN